MALPVVERSSPVPDGSTSAGSRSAAAPTAGSASARAAPVGSRSPEAPLLVEFLGLPGAGKTTVVRAVAAELARGGVEVTEVFAAWNRGKLARATDHALALSALARHNRRALKAAIRLASTSSLARATAVNLALNWANRCGHLETAGRSTGAQLLDQGVFQAYWSFLFAAGRGLDDLFARLEAVRAPVDAVVVVHADPAAIAERLARRPGATSRLERALTARGRAWARAERVPARAAGGPTPAGDARAQAADALARAEDALDQVLALAQAASAASGLRVLEVENRASDMGRDAAANVVAALTGMRNETVYK